MPTRVQQSTVIVLAVQFDQRVRELAQDLAAHPTIIDPRGLAPVSGVDATQDQFTVRLDPSFLQNRLSRMARRKVEHRNNLALLCPLPHEVGTAAPTQHKTKGVQQDRLTRARFTREHVKTRLEL